MEEENQRKPIIFRTQKRIREMEEHVTKNHK